MGNSESICQLYYYGEVENKNCKVLIMGLGGPSLSKLKEDIYPKRFLYDTVLILGIKV